MTSDRTRERKTYPFFRQRPIFEAAVAALEGGPVPTGTGFRHVTANARHSWVDYTPAFVTGSAPVIAPETYLTGTFTVLGRF